MTDDHDLLRALVVESAVGDAAERASELRDLPEFKSVDAFVESKVDDDELWFDVVELVALSLNAVGRHATAPSAHATKKIRAELESLGLEFVPQGARRPTAPVSPPPRGVVYRRVEIEQEPLVPRSWKARTRHLASEDEPTKRLGRVVRHWSVSDPTALPIGSHRR